MEIETLRLVKEKCGYFGVELVTNGTFNARISDVTQIKVHCRHTNGVWQFAVKNGGCTISIFAQRFEFVDESQ